MSYESASSAHGDSHLNALLRIDAVCLRFEQAWNAGDTPAAEALLAEVAEPHQSLLLRELLRIEWECRRTRGDTPTLAEYVARFPTFSTHLQDWWAMQPRTSEPDASHGTDTAQDLAGDSWVGGTNTGTAAPGRSADGLRYRVVRPHARGGLGEVFVAEDLEVRRHVALKEMQPQHADDPASRGRFLQEAEITGGLEHPGIVPVYGLGTRDDGRPYYAMRFIHGESLKEAVAKFHASGEGPSSLAFRTLLNRFVAVCNAVAYAHSRGVVHRDLKPANVMLGPFGETLVVDWGLAKVVGPTPARSVSEGDSAPTPPLPSGSDREPTQAGAVVGTPAYMSPEQASGEPDQVGPVSDVYGLGATLYHLLTGKAPVEHDNVVEILLRVRGGEVVPPRRVKPDVPAALEAVCLKALAPKPEDRYATALALAEDVEHWLADEPVSAYPEPWAARAWKWCRRNPSVAWLAGSVATLLIALAVGSTVAAVYLYAAWDQAERKEKEAIEERKRASENLALAQEAGSTLIRMMGKSAKQSREGFNETVSMLREFNETVFIISERILAQEPSSAEARQALAKNYAYRAALLNELDRSIEAVRDLDHALAFDNGGQRPLYQAARSVALWKATYLHSKLSLSRSGRHEEAIAEADFLASCQGVSSGGLYNCACVYALASAAAPDTAGREQRAAGALALLRRAQALDHFKIKRHLNELKTDKDLDALRGRDDFKRFVAEVVGSSP